MRRLLQCACLLAGCANPQPPHPIAPIQKVNLKPVKDRVVVIQQGNEAIGKSLEDTRISLDKAIVESHQKTVDIANLDRNLQAASKALNDARDEKKTQADQITFLQIDVNAAQEAEDKANLAANAAVTRANTAEGKVYKYEAQEKEDKGNWGFNGIWRWTKYLGWHVVFLIAGIGIITLVIRLFVPMLIPIFTGVWAGILWAVRGFWSILSRLWRPRTPP
jgi:hypothetical protein